MESNPSAPTPEGQHQPPPPPPSQRGVETAAPPPPASATASDQLDNLSNLLINGSWEDEALDQYENETEKTINEHLQVERDQSTQKLFQSFQTSACAVAQMFKDKTMPPQTPWQSFQNSAGAITVLYKGESILFLLFNRQGFDGYCFGALFFADSLEACKVHYDIGVSTGQQRKVKELINWLKKKKRRNIRKDELIGFLIGKQLPAAAAAGSSSMFAFALNPNNFIGGASPASFNHQQASSSSSLSSSAFTNQNRRQVLNRQQQTAVIRNAATSANSSIVVSAGGGSLSVSLPPSSSLASTLNGQQQQQSQTSINNSSSNPPPSANDANYSDLATFREALIMHSK